jgi:hypothetical protein
LRERVTDIGAARILALPAGQILMREAEGLEILK